MKSTIFTHRWILLGVIGFIVCQLLMWGKGWAGGMCQQSVTTLTEGDHPRLEWFEVGFPLRYLTVIREGCFGNRTTTLDWRLGNAAVDVFIFAGLGVMLYALARFWDRFRHR